METKSSVVVPGQEGRGEFGLGAVVALGTVLALAARAAVVGGLLRHGARGLAPMSAS